jgi:cytochrome c-type biogenesis protein CcmH/NrfG
MARAAVKAKQAQKKAAQPAKAAPRRQRGRRKHAGGGNPNQQLFFMRLRRKAKLAYLVLAVLFAITFAFLGVGSGTNGGLDQLFSGLNIFSSSSNPVSKAQKEIKDHPTAAKGYRDLATAYEGKGDTVNAITALQQYTTYKPKSAAAFSELGGLQMGQAQTYRTAYEAATQARQFAAPSASFLPTGKLGQGIGTNPIEQAAASQVDASVQVLQQQTQLAYTNGVASLQKAATLQPNDATAWFTLGQSAQTSGDVTTAVKAYKHYLKLSPNSTSAAQIRQLIKSLSPTPSG